jgi:hypothetical protein
MYLDSVNHTDLPISFYEYGELPPFMVKQMFLTQGKHTNNKIQRIKNKKLNTRQ